jgi:hypothetical protein
MSVWSYRNVVFPLSVFECHLREWTLLRGFTSLVSIHVIGIYNSKIQTQTILIVKFIFQLYKAGNLKARTL